MNHTIIALLGTGLVLAAKYGLIVLAVGYLALKGVKAADAYVVKAKAEHKRIKLALCLDSLAHFLQVGVQAEAKAVQDAVAAGKPAPEVGSVALQTLKDNLGQNGLKELQDILGIVTGEQLEANLKVVSVAAAQKVPRPAVFNSADAPSPS